MPEYIQWSRRALPWFLVPSVMLWLYLALVFMQDAGSLVSVLFWATVCTASLGGIIGVFWAIGLALAYVGDVLLTR